VGLEDELHCLRSVCLETRARVLVIDHYALPIEYYAAARDICHRVVMIDDCNLLPIMAHVVINGNIYASRLKYLPLLEDTRLLIGPAYALLSPEFRDVPDKVVPPNLESILVTFGGGGQEELAVKTVEALSLADVGRVWHVVLGPGFESGERLVALVARLPRVVLHRSPPSLAPLLKGADLVICAGGVTASEAAATGTPAIILIVAANQELSAASFQESGAALSLGWGTDLEVDALAAAIRSLALDSERRRRMSKAGQALFDGCGPVRCVDVIEGILK